MSKVDLNINYTIRINRLFEFIDDNLEGDLSLNAIAKLAYFSPFHFHRIFKFITGETLNEYVTRRRIEKGALDLLHKNITTTKIAHQYGFSDNSSFSRAFKKYYRVCPTEFINQNPHRHTKILPLNSKNGQDYPDYTKYLSIIDDLKNWIKMNSNIDVKEITGMNLAYITAIGPQNLENAFGKLINWATQNGLMKNNAKFITIYHDSFKVTEASKVRLSAAIVIDEPVKKEGEIGRTSIEAGKYIVGRFTIGQNEFEKSWTGMFLWMNENGYKKADKNPFEIYYNNFKNHPEKKAIVELYIPVE